jgi:hypothetical protein
MSDVMADPFLTATPGPSSWAVLTAAVHESGWSTEEMRGASRERSLVSWRQIAMAAAREVTGDSYPALGRVFDRDHTTVIASVRKVNASPRALAARDRVIARARQAWVDKHPGQEVLPGLSTRGSERG